MSSDASLDRTRSVVEYLARSIVDDVDAVSVSVDESGQRPRFDVTAAPNEVGRLIGKRGRTAMAIRAMGRAAATTDGADVDIEFVDS